MKTCLFLFLCFAAVSIAYADTETYNQAVSQAYNNAADPSNWTAGSSGIINIKPSDPHDLQYVPYSGVGNVIVRTLTNSSFYFTNYVGQNYTTFYDKKQVSGGASWVTTGNDLTNFYDTHGNNVTGKSLTKFLERGLGMNSPGTHDAIVEYAVIPTTDYILRPTANPDITSYDPSQYGSSATLQGSDAFQKYYKYWQSTTAPGQSGAFPWTQLGYTYYWGNGGSPPSGVSQIQGMSEFIILGGTAVNIYGIYDTQSYIYTKNLDQQGNLQYGNGYASFNINGPCDSVWAGHPYQYRVSRDAGTPNEINLTNGGSVSGAQGILVWSLNYTVTVGSGCVVSSDGTSLKDGVGSTANIGIMFDGDTTTKYGDPIIVGINKVVNSGIITGNSSYAGTGIDIVRGNATDPSVIQNQSGGLIAGTTAILIESGDATITNNLGATILGPIQSLAGTTTVTNFGTIDIGAGNMSLNTGSGTYSQRAGSTLKLTANSPTSYGKVATVIASLTAGSAIDVTIGGYIPDSTTFKVVDTNASGIEGAVPNTLTSTSPIFTFSGDKSTGDLILTATRAHTYNSFASNSTAAPVGSVLDPFAANNTAVGDMRTILGALDSLSSASQINQALTSLAPNTDNSVPQVGYETQNQFLNTVLSHFDNVPSLETAGDTGAVVLGNDARKVGIWAQGFDTYLHEDPRGLSNGYDANVVGTSLGYDVPVLGNFICGLNAGYAWNNIRTKDSSARTTANSYEGSLYGSYWRGACYVDAILSFDYNQYDSTRHIAFGGLDRVPKSKYGGQQYSAYLESGYTFRNKKVMLTPSVSAQYAHLHVNNYTEEDGGAADLSVAGQDYDMFQTGLGARLSYKLAGKNYTLIPDIHMKWLYDFIGDNQQATSTFTGGGASFPTNGFTPAQSSYDFGTRLVLLSRQNITLALNYDFEIKEDFYSHSGYGNIRYDF